MLGYWLAVVVADVGQMLGKANHKGSGTSGSLTNVDHVAQLTGDGIHQIVALTREGPLDVHLTFGTSNGGVDAQVGACLAPVSGHVPGVVLTWLRRLEGTRMLQRFRSFLKATRGLLQKVVPTVVLFCRAS